MVDFNINLLRCETCNFAQNFLCSLQSFHLIPTTDKPTRVHTNSATLIDNIFSSNVDEITLIILSPTSAITIRNSVFPDQRMLLITTENEQNYLEILEIFPILN